MFPLFGGYLLLNILWHTNTSPPLHMRVAEKHQNAEARGVAAMNHGRYTLGTFCQSSSFQLAFSPLRATASFQLCDLALTLFSPGAA